MVFQQGAEFTIDIYCQDEVFKVCVHIIIIIIIVGMNF
jgi:hypothetical protein